jgi:RNA polymerase sigma-70 factor (ECF subfamily)
MANSQDQELIYLKRLTDGDESAFRYFIKTYQDMAFTIAVSIVKDDFIAQEVAQDAFLKAYKGIKSFNQQSRFKTWFYTIVMNESLLRVKKLKKEFLSFNEIYEADIPDGDFSNVLDESDNVELINSAFKLMLPNESLVLRLFYLEEESIRDIHTITGLSEANIKVLLHRARKNMLHIIQRQKRVKQ